MGNLVGKEHTGGETEISMMDSGTKDSGKAKVNG